MAEYLTATTTTGSRIHAVSRSEYEKVEGTVRASFETMCRWYAQQCAGTQKFVVDEATNCKLCSSAIKRSNT